jgi:hypothetical protein
MKQRPDVLSNWDEAQHDPLSLPPDNFSGMTQDDAVELIKDWFFSNFEDPAQSTPYESAEGGYEYIWGGPYETRDVIENVFADTASDELINAAIDEIEIDGFEWVPNSRRRRPPDDDYYDEPQDSKTLHNKMLERVAELEEIVNQISATHSGIGHNHPPEEIDNVPYTENDRAQLETAISVLKKQPVEPIDDGKAALEAEKIVQTTGAKLLSWLARHANNFISEAVKEGGKEFGKLASRGILLLLAEKLLSVSTIVIKWLSSFGFGLPF